MSTELAPGYCQELGRKCVDARAEIERLRALVDDWKTTARLTEAENERLRGELVRGNPLVREFLH